MKKWKMENHLPSAKNRPSRSTLATLNFELLPHRLVRHSFSEGGSLGEGGLNFEPKARLRTLPCAVKPKVYPSPVTEIEKLLCDLIALPSVNPAFLPANHPDAGEGRVAAFLAAAARQAGLDVELQKVLPGRANVLARLSPAGKVKGRILLAPHMDTVAALSPGQFTPRRRAGRLYGRGACDTKGSIAAMLGRPAGLGAQRPAPRCHGDHFRGVD